MVLSRLKVLVSYILRAVVDLKKNFQVGANIDPREYPGSQSGLWDRQVAGVGSWLFAGNLDNLNSRTKPLPADLKFHLCLLAG